MALTAEEIIELKNQLKQQVNDLSEPQKTAALKQIDSLTPQALELMIKQQKNKGVKVNETQKGVFRAIIDGEIKSHIITQNKEAIAVLDIKPISPGHSIIIPKIPAVDAKSIPNSSFALAKKISKRISKRLNSKSSEIQTEYKFGEMIINVIPIYDKSLNLLSPRIDSSENDLENIWQKIKIIKKERKPRIKKELDKKDTAPKLDRRIP